MDAEKIQKGAVGTLQGGLFEYRETLSKPQNDGHGWQEGSVAKALAAQA